MDINILGSGLMGKQVAALLYLGGFNINVWNHREIDEKTIYRNIKMLNRMLAKTCEGTMVLVSNINDLPDAVTIECVREDIDIKKKVYKYFCDSKSAYFTNTSSLCPTDIGENVNAMHFFNPINMGLIELYCCTSSAESSITSILDYLKTNEFFIVNVNNSRGYIGNYILFNEISSALKLVEKYNYNVDQINSVYKKLYGVRNIFSIIDLIGVDVTYEILKNLKEEDESIYMPNILLKALNKNILGKKNKTTIKSLL